MNIHYWPTNPNSPKVDTSIDWTSVPFDVMRQVDLRRVRAIPTPMLSQLYSRYRELWDVMPKDAKELGLAILEGRPPIVKKPQKKAGAPKTDKDRLLDAITDIEEIAADDPGVLLKAVETRAKLLSLLNVKPEQEDKVINIYVNTGVTRE